MHVPRIHVVLELVNNLDQAFILVNAHLDTQILIVKLISTNVQVNRV